jgi:anthranilate synthase component 1
MIEFKKVNAIQIEGVDLGMGLRSTAFGVYLNLLEQFGSRELFLLESMGPSSIDTRASLIGINPVLNIEVFDRIISISGNQQLLKKLS